MSDPISDPSLEEEENVQYASSMKPHMRLLTTEEFL